MKIKRIIGWLPVGMLMLILLNALVSWIGNIYDFGLHSLFSAEGIRWSFVNAIPNITRAPFVELFMFLIALSVVVESGILRAFKPKSSLKQKRALSVALLVLIILVAVFAAMLFMPNAILLSPFGTLANSPFLQGIFELIVIIVIVVCNVYGLASGRFFNMNDIINAHISILSRCLPCFLIMLLAAEFMGTVNYVYMISPSDTLFIIISRTLFFFPFALQLISSFVGDD